MSAATAGAPADTGASNNPYEKLYHYDDEDYYDPHCFFSSGLAQNRKRLGFIATCSTVQCKDAGSAGYDPLLPFKEDLAEWLYKMIRAEIAPNRFFPELQAGVYLCKLGIHMQKMAVKYRREHPEDTSLVPPKPPHLKYANATRKSPPFYCRDNISNFLDWSIEFGVKHSCRFETDDLTLRKNDRQIVIHLMEVGRLGVKFGIEPPTLIKLEMSLDDPMPAPVKGASTLDEKVQACAAECCCSVPFKVNRVSEGRYKVGEGRSIVFVRVLRSHVMVRVGGGWETLNAYFSKMDPCRNPMDSFGGKPAESPTGKIRRYETEVVQPVSPSPRIEPEPEQDQELEVEVDSAPPPVVAEAVAPVQAAVPPVKPKRPSPAAIAATSDSLRKPAPPRTRSPTKSPVKQSASNPAVSKAPPATPRAASPKKSPARKPSPAVSRESITSPTPRPASIKAPTITPRQTRASLLRTSSPSAIKTPSPANSVSSPNKVLSPTGSGGLSHPPWKYVPNAAAPLSRTNSAPQKPASRVSGEAGPSTPNFQRPDRASTLDRKEPPTQNKRLIPVGGKNLPKSDKYDRATQRVSGKPKITSPELIRRAMEIMKDNGEVEEEEEVVRTPTEPALIAAIEEIAEEEYQCEAGEAVDVEVPDPLTESGPPGPLPEPSVTSLAPDSGVDTLAESKPLRVTENATVGDSSVPFVSGGDTLQDISDMITDDQDHSEMENLEELPSDDAGYEVQDLPSQEIVIEPIGLYCEDEASQEFEPTLELEAESVNEVAAEAPSQPQIESEPAAQPQVVEADPQPEPERVTEARAGLLESDYDGGTTEDELNEAVGADDYASKIGGTRHDSTSSANSGQVTGSDIPVDRELPNEDVVVGVTISYPSEHQLAINPEVEQSEGWTMQELPVQEEKGATVEFLDPSELEKSDDQNEPEVDPVDIDENLGEPEEIHVEDLGEEGDAGEEGNEEVEEEDEKHIYVANVESEYDVSQQLQAMNEVELAISEGEEDEAAPVITESMIQRMEEYMRPTSDLEETIDDLEETIADFAKNVEGDSEGAEEEVEDLVETEEDQGDDLGETVAVENEGDIVDDELKESEVDKGDDLEDNSLEQLEAEVNDEASLKDEQLEEPDETIEEFEVPASTIERQEEFAGAKKALEDSISEFERVKEEVLPVPIIIVEENVSDDTASPPTAVAADVDDVEEISFAEKVQKLEHMIKTHPQKIPRPSDESVKEDIEVDNAVGVSLSANIPDVQMGKIKETEAVVSVDEKKESDDIDTPPPPIKAEGDQEIDDEPVNLEDVLAESMEHIPAPIEDLEEPLLPKDVLKVEPLVDEPIVESSVSPQEPSSEAEIQPSSKEAPVEAEKAAAESEDQSDVKHVEISKSPEPNVVVAKEPCKEVSLPAKAAEVQPEADVEIEDLEVIEEAAEDEGGPSEHPLSESEEVVMKPDKTPLPNNSTLNMAPRRYSFEAEKAEEPDRTARSSKRSLNSSGHTSDSDRSTASEKDTSSGYHEDYETSDGDELGTSYEVPDVIMEQDQQTRSILKGSARESVDSGKQSLSSTPSLPKQRLKSVDDDDVFEEERAKGLNLPSEGHVREAVFTKAIESAINPLAYGIQIPNMGELQSASIVLPSKKAIRKASDGEYDYHGRRTNLQKVISKPHTEKTDMEWDDRDQAKDQEKTDSQTRDEKVHNWSGTLRSSQKKKKTFRSKKYDDDDILNAITFQAPANQMPCPVHAAAGSPVTGPPKRRVPSAKRPGATATRRAPPSSRPAARPSASAKTTVSRPKPKTTNVKAKVDSRRPSSSSLPVSKPAPKGSKAIAVKPASRTSNPQEVMSIPASPSSGPITPSKTKPVLQVTKSAPIRRTGSLRKGERAPLKLSNSLPRDKIRPGPKCTDLP